MNRNIFNNNSNNFENGPAGNFFGAGGKRAAQNGDRRRSPFTNLSNVNTTNTNNNYVTADASFEDEDERRLCGRKHVSANGPRGDLEKLVHQLQREIQHLRSSTPRDSTPLLHNPTPEFDGKSQHQSKSKKGTVILLDGAFASGKRTCLLALQNLSSYLQGEWRFLSRESYYNVNHPHPIQNMWMGMLTQAKRVAEAGGNCVMEVALSNNDLLRHATQSLQNVNVITVLLYTPLLHLPRRSAMRNADSSSQFPNAGKPSLTLQKCLMSYVLTYTGFTDRGDMCVDILRIEEVNNIIQQVALSEGWDRDTAIQRRAHALYLLGFITPDGTEVDIVNLEARVEHDFVVDTSSNNAVQCAEMILQFFNGNKNTGMQSALFHSRSPFLMSELEKHGMR